MAFLIKISGLFLCYLNFSSMRRFLAIDQLVETNELAEFGKRETFCRLPRKAIETEIARV